MLELAFGRPGRGQQIASVLALMENNYIFSLDDLQMITQAREEDLKVILGKNLSHNSLLGYY